MASEISIEVKTVKNALPRMIRRLPFYADSIAKTVCKDALEVMQQLTPVGPEDKHDFNRWPLHLVDSEHIEHIGPASYAIVIDNSYWEDVNYGTRYMAAQPFVEPAIEAAQRAAGPRATVAMNQWQAEGAL